MTEWIITCNTKYYDVVGAFSKLNKINWKQSVNVEQGDIVYIYVGKPYSAIKYKCIATKVDLLKEYIDDTEFVLDGTVYENYGRYMELQLLEAFDDSTLNYIKLKEEGLKSVQGPSKVSKQLSKYINRITIKFKPELNGGQVITNEKIVEIFQCGNMGGMRPSSKTNTLVIVSDHTKGLYDDKWFGDILHYTGMGKSGDQDLKFMWNKTLAESNSNGVDVHLFEVLKPGQYIYLGLVELADKPYQENQVGEDGLQRKVWMFPIRLKSGEVPINQDSLVDNEERKKRQARKLSTEELKKRAENSKGGGTSIRNTISPTYIRDPYVIEYAKRVANGYCQLCGEKAPFNDNNGNSYLETHHIVWLSKGGEDTIENTAALCPNCHRKMHVLDLKEDVEKLKYKKIK